MNYGTILYTRLPFNLRTQIESQHTDVRISKTMTLAHRMHFFW